MNAKEFVDSLFEGYEETAALADFKEELLGNLNAKIESLVKKGMDGETAFAKASAELGDVSALADEMSLKKRNEVFEEVYMGVRKYMSSGRVMAYMVFGGLAFLGIVIGGLVFFTARAAGDARGIALFAAMFVSAMPVFAIAATGFTFLGVTQETVSTRPASKRRGTWYAAAVALIAIGFSIMPALFFEVSVTETADFVLPCPCDYECCVEEPCGCGRGRSIHIGFNFPNDGASSPSVLIFILPFALSGIGLLVFLILTEKDRLKPWAKAMQQKAKESRGRTR